jgi:hypothetical protein
MSSIAILAVLWVAPYWQQAQFIAELREQHVFVYCEYDGPQQLSWCPGARSIFVRPAHVQVLLQPDTDSSVRLLGKAVPVVDVHEKLSELRDFLRTRLGVDGFLLVHGFQVFPEHVIVEIWRQQRQAARKSKSEFFYHLTPCGISNFRYVRELPPKAFGN